MSDVTVSLIIAHFAGEEGASAALQELRGTAIRLYNAATLRTDPNGKLHVHEAHKLSEQGDPWGGIVAGSVGLIAASALVFPVASAAALIGLGATYAAKKRKSGDTRELAAKVEPGSSTLLVTLPPDQVVAAKAQLGRTAASIHVDTVDESTAKELEGGQKLVLEALQEAQEGAKPVASYYGTTRTE
ncbi:MAG: hypothetical protein HGA45_34825 [Chloroflexales bacterium]|nr:hypothetical protein [Chloroflexales bacterium]